MGKWKVAAGFEKIPGFRNYFISKNGTVYNAKTNMTLKPFGNGKVCLCQDRKKIYIKIKDTVEEVFGSNDSLFKKIFKYFVL